MESTVLLADDSITVQKIVKLSLAEEGIEVVTVGNGEQAVQKLHEMRPSLVLADVFMPGKDGYEVCEYVKTQPALSDLPVILLVHAYEPFDAERAKQVGADRHLTKPFQSIRALVEAVQEMLPATTPATAPGEPSPEASDGDAEEMSAVTPITPFTPAEESHESPAEMMPDQNPLADFGTHPSTDFAEPPPEPAGMLITLAPEPTPAALPEENIPPVYPLTHSEEELMLPLVNEDAAEPVERPHFAPQPEPVLEPLMAFEPMSAEESLPPFEPMSAGVDEEVLDLGDVLAPSPFGAPPEPDLLADADSLPTLASLMPSIAPSPEVPPEAPQPDFLPSPLMSFDMALGQRMAAVEPSENDARPMTAAPAATEPLELAATDGPQMEAPQTEAPKQDVVAGFAAPQNGAGGSVQFSDAVIDQIVSRVVQQLSSKAIEEVAWEVVPELAEAIIRKQVAEH